MTGIDWIGKKVRVIKSDIGERTVSKIGTIIQYDAVFLELKLESGKNDLIPVGKILRVEMME